MRRNVSKITKSTTLKLLGVVLLAGTAAGCSSDASRFMYSGVDGINTASVPGPSSNALQPVGSVPNAGYAQAGTAPSSVSQAYPGDARQSGYDQTYTGSVGSSARTASSSQIVSRQSLPTAEQSASRIPVGPATRPVTEPQPFPTRTARVESNASVSTGMPSDPITTGSTPARSGNGWSGNGGTSVTLNDGETLYNLSRRYGVPVKDIMAANNITDASRVNAGQRIVIPVYGYSDKAPVSAPDADPNVRDATASRGTPAPKPNTTPEQQVAVLPTSPSLKEKSSQAAPADTASAPQAGGQGGVYNVQSGDTLSRIASRHSVSVAALKAANGMSTEMIRVGQTLSIPSGGAPAAATDSVTTASVKPAADKPKEYAAPAKTETKSNIIETAKVDTNAVAPKATGIDKLRWPARGQVITGYAKSEDGKRNDGIDLSLPVGTPVKAAENGVVIYSGDGLKEYGNTVLVRHDDGLVTVYAHASELKVNRGDKVTRGQTIASSGMSGNAKTPRLHFEVRKNATPVNPSDFLE
ncbi:LysM peptidoglycan-binding domain-containing protein [Pseudohoeflea suaedae]|uniref:LysM peptidoglycan-binding domain-containing protein n=1 Tax=Pseudohoeflea suaedae TaxID=877384 RepID=A0A4R5PQ05_9HYPH|nr:peptidoglycan DD-metalloendopeptidase family protein [Pseudohoeflea suaedae]TDH39192.1 LysM peptidoglycan-binding domain-containing protein [Pseudohoeflea suaedae]